MDTKHSGKVAQVSIQQQAVKPVYDTRPGTQIIIELGKHLGIQKYFDFTIEDANRLRVQSLNVVLEDLKKKGLDAYWIETVSGGKTWYQVRIAPGFPDQQSAREYGRNLKWKGVIDDFYVTG